MVCLEFIKYRINDRLRHNHLNVIECLFRICRSHGLNYFFIILFFLRGQLTHASLCQDCCVLLYQHLFGLLQNIVLNLLAQLRECFTKCFCIVIFDGLVHFLNDLGLFHC